MAVLTSSSRITLSKETKREAGRSQVQRCSKENSQDLHADKEGRRRVLEGNRELRRAEDVSPVQSFKAGAWDEEWGGVPDTLQLSLSC